MALQIEYDRHHQRKEPEILQNIIIKCFRYSIKSMYPEKIFHSFLKRSCGKICSI